MTTDVSSSNHSNNPVKAVLEQSFHSQLFCYEIENNRIFIEPKIKMEVLEDTAIYPIPNAPKWYSGVTSLRGDILTVVNMHYLLGFEESKSTKRLLRLEHPNFPPLAIAIDNLPHQRNIEKLASNHTPNTSHYPSWIKSTSQQSSNTFLFADHSALFEAMQNNSTPLITTVSLPAKD